MNALVVIQAKQAADRKLQHRAPDKSRFHAKDGKT